MQTIPINMQVIMRMQTIANNAAVDAMDDVKVGGESAAWFGEGWIFCAASCDV